MIRGHCINDQSYHKTLQDMTGHIYNGAVHCKNAKKACSQQKTRMIPQSRI